jgi:hypothetical protein
MLFGNQDAQTRWIKNVSSIIILSLVMAIVLSVSACNPAKGSIVILENPNATGFTMDFKEWSAKNKGELSLRSGDVLQIEVVREEGEVALTVSGKKGSEPYTGNHLETGVFTITVSETDVYLVQITGKDATGKVTVKNVERGAK